MVANKMVGLNALREMWKRVCENRNYCYQMLSANVVMLSEMWRFLGHIYPLITLSSGAFRRLLSLSVHRLVPESVEAEPARTCSSKMVAKLSPIGLNVG